MANDSRMANKVDATSGRVNSSTKRQDAASTFFNAFNPRENVENLHGNLPHWRQDRASYFVTFRTADSLPAERVEQLKRERQQWLLHHPEPHSDPERQEYWRLFPARLESWLDEAHGACVLATKELRELVEETLWHFHMERYDLCDEVVMPNHVHAIVRPLGNHSLSSIMQSWKSFTAHEINKALKRAGMFWQKESFDHIIRSAESLAHFRDYIEENRQCRRGLRPRGSQT